MARLHGLDRNAKRAWGGESAQADLVAPQAPLAAIFSRQPRSSSYNILGHSRHLLSCFHKENNDAKNHQPTLLPPVVIARLLEQHGSPLAPLAEEIHHLAIAYRIDAAFALAHCMVESQFGCQREAQINCNPALVRASLTRLAAPGGPLRPAETTPILPQRYSDDFGSGYSTYPSWLTGIEEYFRLLRLVFVDAWHEEKVKQIAQAFLATTPGRKGAPNAALCPLTGAVATLSAAAPGLSATQPGAVPISQQELDSYIQRIERHRAAFQGQ